MLGTLQSWHDCRIVDWEVKHQLKETKKVDKKVSVLLFSGLFPAILGKGPLAKIGKK